MPCCNIVLHVSYFLFIYFVSRQLYLFLLVRYHMMVKFSRTYVDIDCDWQPEIKQHSFLTGHVTHARTSSFQKVDPCPLVFQWCAPSFSFHLYVRKCEELMKLPGLHLEKKKKKKICGFPHGFKSLYELVMFLGLFCSELFLQKWNTRFRSSHPIWCNLYIHGNPLILGIACALNQKDKFHTLPIWNLFPWMWKPSIKQTTH